MKFRKKPIEIEAVQWTGTSNSLEQIARFTNGLAKRVISQSDTPALGIETLEGTMTATVGDWIIRGVKGEFYPCKPDIFAATYEMVEAQP